MKKQILALLVCFAGICVPLSAQTEGTTPTIDFDGGHYKDFGGFLLDMSPVMMTPPPIRMSLTDFRLYDTGTTLLRVNPEAFSLPTGVTYTRGTAALSSPIPLSTFTATGGTVQWQGASYRLKNGLRINTYGEYDADGYKRFNPAALPWERNRFNAAFEVKSANGKFGVRVEMQGGGNYRLP